MPDAGCRPSRVSATWAPASRLPCRTWTSAALATCWVPSRADSSPIWVMKPTSVCSKRPLPNCVPRSLRPHLPPVAATTMTRTVTAPSLSPTASWTPTSNSCSPPVTCLKRTSASPYTVSWTTWKPTIRSKPSKPGWWTASARYPRWRPNSSASCPCAAPHAASASRNWSSASTVCTCSWWARRTRPTISHRPSGASSTMCTATPSVVTCARRTVVAASSSRAYPASAPR